MNNIEKKHYIYVILTINNKLYCGYTNDVLKRYKQHKEGRGAKFTKANKPSELLFYKELDSKHQALREEYYFKKLSRKKKLEYIKNN